MSERTPDYAKPLMGVREWDSGEAVPGLLTSITSSGRYRPWYPEEELVAECWPAQNEGIPLAYLHREADDPPGKGCRCGIYAYYDLKTKRALVPRRHFRVEGVVAAAGRVILHDRGFRAERARIVALIQEAAPDSWGMRFVGGEAYLEYLAERYGVPIIEAEEAEKFMEEHGVVLAPKVPPEAEYEPSWGRLPHPPPARPYWRVSYGLLVLINIGFLAWNLTPEGSWWGILNAAALAYLWRQRPR